MPWRVQLGRIPRFRSDYVFPDARRKFHKLEPNAKTARPVQPPFQKLAKEIREPFVSVVLKVPGSRVCVLVIESLHDPLDVLFLDIEYDPQLGAALVLLGNLPMNHEIIENCQHPLEFRQGMMFCP